MVQKYRFHCIGSKLYAILQGQITECEGTSWDKQNKKADFEAANHCYVLTDCEHDYDEPYFEPASEFDILLEQLKELSVTNILERSLGLVAVLYRTNFQSIKAKESLEEVVHCMESITIVFYARFKIKMCLVMTKITH